MATGSETAPFAAWSGIPDTHSPPGVRESRSPLRAIRAVSDLRNEPPVLEITGLSKHFPGVQALEDAWLEVRPGEVHGLVGENGAGKSTMIKILAGAERRDAGEIRIDGELVPLASEGEADDRGLHFVHQDVALVPRQTVAENLFLGHSLPKRGPFVDRNAMNDQAAEWLAGFTEADPATPVGQLGVADRWMVAIAKACAGEARVVVMDEPTVALADAEVERLYAAVARLKRDGIAVLFVSHRLGEIMQLSDRVTVMKDGRTVATHATDELDRTTLIRHIIGEEGGALDLAEPRLVTDDQFVLEVEGLCGGPLVDVGFKVARGEILGIGGLVGSGRTSILLNIFGALRPAAGEIRLAGSEVHFNSPTDAIKNGIALIPEDRRGQGLLPKRTVRENIVLAHLRNFRWVPRLPVPSRKRELASSNDQIDSLRIVCTGPEQTMATLSGGNQQKALLARSLVTQTTKVLMLDEPTKGVDVGARAEILNVITQLAAEGVAVIMVSSDLEEVAAIAHRVVVLREGRLVADLPCPVTESDILAECYGFDVSEVSA
jgi:ABC-type sugar transport system ATPase subunit